MRSHTVSRVLLAALASSLLLAIAVPGHAARAAEPSQQYQEVDAFLRERSEASKTPGLAYAIVTPSAVEHMGTWGNDGDGRPVAEDTPFLWGSVSKPITVTAVMALIESGAVALDEPVRTYLQSLTLADPDTASRITVRHLLEQTSGIPDGTGVTDRFDPRSDPYGDALADLADVTPVSAPGERHEYASANYLVLGAMVEAVTGQRFTEYLSEHVLRPLAMSHTIANPDDADTALPGGHGYAFGHPVGVRSRYDLTGPSYGYLGGSVEDLAHFARAQLNGGRYGSTQVLDGASVELMQTGAARVSDTHRYGLGWRDDDRNADLGTRTVWHGGAVQGYQAMIVLLPDIDRGIVVLQNIYGFFQDSQLAAVGLGAARLLAGGQPGEASADSTYPLILAGLVAVLAGVVVAIAWPVYRLLRPGAHPVRRRRVLTWTAAWVLIGTALAYIAGAVLPSLTGTRLSLIPLWAPDVGWLTIAIIIASAVLAATWLASGIIRLRRSPAGDRHAVPAVAASQIG